MCILLATTAHPSYSLIILDNRDEFIRRPTSQPHWWKARRQHILSSRDLLRKEQGTWLGITKTGNFAVLTNFREDEDPNRPLQGLKSRGGMVTAWLTAPDDESTEEFVKRMLDGDGVQGVGGFSLVCGKLRRRKDKEADIEPFAIISNRATSADQVPWIASERGEVYGLSNTSFNDPVIWPKVKLGKEKIVEVVEAAVSNDLGENELVDKLFELLDTNTMPPLEGDDIQQHMRQLRHSIFIPPIGEKKPLSEIPPSEQEASADVSSSDSKVTEDISPAAFDAPREPALDSNTFMAGVYGTQRQTILLVDWDGNVTYVERSLWDELGKQIERGEGDVRFEFKIDGWNGERKGNEFRTLAVL